jgi:16S rRNA (cytidine1402-2'-O)-methyltransferase
MKSKESSMKPGTLYIVGTPIGNLKDITVRALEVLKGVDLIAAEDTRQTQKILLNYHFSTPLTSYHDHNKDVKAEVLIVRMKEGARVALVTDAGTPGISDPGYHLIRRAAEEGIPISPIPGPTAMISALTVSGLPLDAFVFEGFLPSRRTARRRRLESMASERRTLVFFEAPHRVRSVLQDMLETWGDREMALARELTKIHEEILRGTISGILKQLEGKEIRGEITLILAGARERSSPLPGSYIPSLNRLLKSGIGVKEAASRISREFGVSRKKVYSEALKILNES